MNKLHPLARALALGVAALAAPMIAHATLISSATYAFTGSASVTDSQGGGSTSNNGASLGTSSISQFNSSLGVLTGTSLNLTSTRTQSTWVTSTDGPNTGNNNPSTANGNGSSTANISAPGVNNTFSPVITNSDSCAGNRQESCVGTASTSTTSTNLSANIPGANLNSYVGVGSVTVARAAPALTATQGSNTFTGTASTVHTLTWAGDLGVTYSYLLNAAPSFDGSSTLLTLNLDFGTVFLNAADPTLAFSIFDLADADRAGLDLDSITGSGDMGQLATNLALFSGLGQGGSNAYMASFDTAALGVYSASYTLDLSDADVGASTSRKSHTLTLNLMGEIVAAQPAPVPEPATLALLGIGLLGLGVLRRRSR